MNQSNLPNTATSTGLIKSNLPNLSNCHEITLDVAEAYQKAYPNQFLYDRIEADYKAQTKSDFPPLWSDKALAHPALFDPSQKSEYLDVCDECGKPFKCECDPDKPCECGKSCVCENDWEANKEEFKRIIGEAKERQESNISVWNDGDTTWLGMSFKPVFEPGEDERDEQQKAYFGGHTFRDHGITQLIRSTSEGTGVPEPFCALMVAFMFSSACGKGLQVSFKPGEQTSLGIYALPLARSGTGKTLAGKILCGPLTDLHSDRRKEWERSVKPGLDAKKKVLTSKLNKLTKQSDNEGEDSDEILNQMVQLQTKLDEIERSLHAPTLYLEDVTVERLASILPITGEQMTYYSSDAGAAIQNILGKYNKDSRPDDHILLKSYSLEPFSQARLTRDDVNLESPWGSMLWMTQPDKWNHLSENEWLRDGGFLPRCLLAQFECEPQYDDGTNKTVPLPLLQHYNKRFRSLYKSYREPMETGSEPKIIKVSKEAAQMMRDFHNEITNYRRGADSMDAFAARWVENAKRIAGVLHASYFGSRAHEEPVHWVTVSYAIKAMRWFIDRQNDLMREAVDQKTSGDMQKLFDKLKRSGGFMTLKNLKNDHWSEIKVRTLAKASGGMIQITEHANSNATKTVYVHNKGIDPIGTSSTELAEVKASDVEVCI